MSAFVGAMNERCRVMTPAGVDGWGKPVQSGEVREIRCKIDRHVQESVSVDGIERTINHQIFTHDRVTNDELIALPETPDDFRPSVFVSVHRAIGADVVLYQVGI